MLNFNSSNIVSKTKTIGRRMFLISAIKATVLAGIFGRLVFLQITESQKYKVLSDKNRFREWHMAPPRGIVKDFFNNELATNEKVYQLHLTPENILEIDKLFFRLKSIVNLSDNKIAYLKKKIKKQKPWEPIVINENMTWSEFSRINLFLHELQGVEPIVSIARVYTNISSSHILGYVSQVSPRDLKNRKYLKDFKVAGISVGKTGLEAKLDEDMIGKVGYQRYEVNAYGKRIKRMFINKGESGKNFKTTLDIEVQNYAAELIKDVSAAVCVMDIFSGDIVTMASSPTYDPNAFVHGIGQNDWNFLLNHRDKPLTNKAISGLYPPGSTIKTIVALSALENDIANTKNLVNCKGSIDFYGQKFHCWKKKGHGFMNMRKAIQRSCDVYFYEIARKLGIDRLSETAKKFGLGSKVLEGFAEERSGVVPNTKWKRKYIGQNWYLGETLHSGIGQGYFLATPLQLCLMTAQIANGGFKIKPRIIFDGDKRNSIKDYANFRNEFPNDPLPTDMLVANFELKPLFRNQENINFVKDAMFAATNEPGGTSYRSRNTKKGFIFAGKTGSSQIKRFTAEQRELEVKQKDIVYGDRDHALFTAFAPYHNPRYAISVLIEHGGSGSKAAAPVAKKVLTKVIKRHELRSTFINNFGKEI
jgi:penicillin-binding protein 2